MIIAALVSFGILLLAWVMAPDVGLPRIETAARSEERPMQIAA